MIRKYFNPYISESLFIRPHQLYGNTKNTLQNLDYFKKSNIYFITSMDKVRISTKSVKINWSTRLKFTLQNHTGKKITVTVPLPPIIIDCGNVFRRVYGTEDCLQTNLIKVNSLDQYKNQTSKRQNFPLIGVYINPLDQLPDEISITIFTPDGRTNKLQFTLHSILSKFEIDIGSLPEVRYIGQTKDLKKRMYNHEKIQQAMAESRDHSDVYLYLIQFDEQKLERTEINGTTIFNRDKVIEIKKSSKIDLVEMCLINYFKPRPLNSDFVNANIPSNEKVKRHLKENGYTDIFLEIDHYGRFWEFGSEAVKNASRHEIQFQLNNS